MRVTLAALAALGIFAIAPLALAADNSQETIISIPWVGSKGVVDTVEAMTARQALEPAHLPLKFGAPIRKDTLPEQVKGAVDPAWEIPSYPDPNALAGALPEPFFSVGTSFIGPTGAESGFVPPDTMGGVSPTQIFIPVNGRFRLYNKNGTAGSLNVSANTFFDSIRNGSNVSDPRCWWDRLTNRWFVCAINVSSPNRVLIGVSNSATISAVSSFTFFQFTQDVPNPNAGDTGGLFDYPCMGVDANGIYIGGNVFNPGFVGRTVFVIRKSSVLGAGPIVVSAFRAMGGVSTPMGVSNDDPAATSGLVVGPSTTSSTAMAFRRISNVTTTPTLGPTLNVTVPSIVQPADQIPLGSSSPVDTLDTRVFTAQNKLNRIAGTRSIWLSHNIRTNSTGTASSTGDRVSARWYQFNNVDTTPTLTQSGAVTNPAAVTNYTIPSISSNGQGHAMLGATNFSPSQLLSVGGATRLRTSTLGTMTLLPTLQAGLANYNIGLSNGAYRWGDYSQTVVDPADDQTFWTFQEYCSANNTWAVRAVQIKAPLPVTPTTLVPNSIKQGETLNIVVSGASVNGTEFFDPGSEFTGRLRAALSGTGLTVNSVTFNSPTQFTMNVTASTTATLGARNLTVTNPDGQTSSGNGLLTVTSGQTQVEVKVTLLDHTSPLDRPVTIGIRNPGSTTNLETVSGNLIGGSITFLSSVVTPGTFYDVAVKGPTWLRKTVSNIGLGTSVVTATLTNGDCDGNNVIDFDDLGIIATNYELATGFDVRADLNGSGTVDFDDLAIIATNYELNGDN